MKNNTPETIDKYADMDIVEFITNLTEQKSFVEINAMINLFKIEQSRVVQLREHLAKSFATLEVGSEEYQQTFNSYICTWVIEQKIIDRMAVAVHIKDMKGVSNVLRPKEPQNASEGQSEASESAPRTSRPVGNEHKSPRSSKPTKNKANKHLSVVSGDEAKSMTDMSSDELAEIVVNTGSKKRS